jgi:hypothetical protein
MRQCLCKHPNTPSRCKHPDTSSRRKHPDTSSRCKHPDTSSRRVSHGATSLPPAKNSHRIVPAVADQHFAPVRGHFHMATVGDEPLAVRACRSQPRVPLVPPPGHGREVPANHPNTLNRHTHAFARSATDVCTLLPRQFHGCVHLILLAKGVCTPYQVDWFISDHKVTAERRSAVELDLHEKANAMHGSTLCAWNHAWFYSVRLETCMVLLCAPGNMLVWTPRRNPIVI